MQTFKSWGSLTHFCVELHDIQLYEFFIKYNLLEYFNNTSAWKWGIPDWMWLKRISSLQYAAVITEAEGFKIAPKKSTFLKQQNFLSQ